MKIRVTNSNNQQDRICFEEITSIFAMPCSGDPDYNSVKLELQVDTLDSKELNVAQDDVPYLLFLYFHNDKYPEMLSGEKALELEEIMDAFEQIYLRYKKGVCSGVFISH